MRLVFGVAFTLLCLAPAVAQEGTALTEVAIHRGGGEPADIGSLIQSVREADVLLVGELHDDEAGHRFKRVLLEEIDRADRRQVVLSLEMFERDVQIVIDEFLADHITEAHFTASARAWPNYERDYRPMVMFAKENGLPVVAANVPRRYVNLVAREGMAALNDLFGQSRTLLPPLPLPGASDKYRAAFMERMEGMPAHGGVTPENMFEAQRLWDAGMAESIVQALDMRENALVMHVAGSFHVERDTGIPDMIRAYRPELRLVSVVVRPGEAFGEDDHLGLGDFVVITSPSVD